MPDPARAPVCLRAPAHSADNSSRTTRWPGEAQWAGRHGRRGEGGARGGGLAHREEKHGARGGGLAHREEEQRRQLVCHLPCVAIVVHRGRRLPCVVDLLPDQVTLLAALATGTKRCSGGARAGR
jgi:hypothetical protein